MLNFKDGDTTPQEILSIIVITLSTLTSTTLNPLVYRYSTSRPRSIATSLFRVLSIVDLTTSILLPVHIFTTALLSEPHPEGLPGQFECAGAGWWNCLGLQVSVFQKARSVGVLALLVSSLLVTSVMAICRWAQIVYPFKNITFRSVAVLLAAGLLVSVAMQVYSLFISNRPVVWVVQIMTAWTDDAFNFHSKTGGQCRLLQISLVFSVSLLFQLFGLIASVLTIREIVSRRVVLIGAESKQSTRKGTIKIIATNFGNFLFVVIHIITFIVQFNSTKTVLNDHEITVNSSSEAWMNFSFGYIFPIMLSALNPVIFLIFTPKALNYLPWSNKIGELGNGSERLSVQMQTKLTPLQRIRKEAGNLDRSSSPSPRSSPISNNFVKRTNNCTRL